MAEKTDTNALLLAQITSHAEALSRLLATGSMEPIEAGVIERAMLSTSMLANSTSLMDLPAMHDFLRAYEELLGVYRDKGLPWDEKISQLTSEVIEQEDKFVVDGKAKGATSLKSIISDDEADALLNELEDVRAYAEEASPPAPVPKQKTSPPPQVAKKEAPKPMPPAKGAREREESHSAVDHKAPSRTQDAPLAGSVRGLNRHVASFLNRWESSTWDITDLDPGVAEQARRDLFSAAFHALSIEQMLGVRTANRASLCTDSLAAVSATLQDFSRVLCAGTDRSIDIKLIGEDNRIDVALLFPIVRIIQNMIGDVSLRCKEKYLRIEVIVQEENGSLIWSLRDNGDNFISDTPLDPDEYLAFYPSLRETRKILAELRSLLWVEPDESHDTRFAFSSPLSLDGGGFVVWERGDRSFGVPSSQVSDIVALGDIELRSDAHGEYVSRDGGRIPVIRLDQIFGDIDIKGDRIAIIGELEKRVAFFVEGGGEVVVGTWLKGAVSPWRGHKLGVVQFGDRKATVVEANDLLGRYLSLIGDVGEDRVAGASSEPSIAPAQADAGKRREKAPVGEAKAHVLVVEKSEAMRNALASILAAKDRIRTTFVDELEAAIDRLVTDAPCLIISEFRVPSMAAKVIAERLRAEGRDIPIIVTTTQGGKQAELLVQKIGVDGYITKPLDSADVLKRIDSLLHGKPTTAPRT